MSVSSRPSAHDEQEVPVSSTMLRRGKVARLDTSCDTAARRHRTSTMVFTRAG